MKTQFRLPALVVLGLVAVALSYYWFVPRPRAWPRGAWDAADHNRDGQLTRNEMVKFVGQASHRNGPRLLWHFDSADTNGDGMVDGHEAEAYG